MYYLCYALLYCIIFAFGAAIGSFLNVCIYRLPKEESLWRNNSHCMTCGTPIRKRDLIPIFSWCRLRGKCHSCGAKIPFRYTLVESLNAVLYVLIYAYFGIFDRPLYAGLVCLFCSALVVVFFMDLDPSSSICTCWDSLGCWALLPRSMMSAPETAPCSPTSLAQQQRPSPCSCW